MSERFTPPPDRHEERAYGSFGKRNKSPQKVQTIGTSESAIVNACIRWCWAHGIKARRQNTGAYKTETGHYVRYGKKGAGDIIFCLRAQGGRYGEIECKRPGQPQQPEQIAHQQQIEDDGGLYILAYSVDDLELKLKPLLRGP